MKIVSRRKFLSVLAHGARGAASLYVIPSLFSCGKQPDKLNFVFILIDDLGWTDLGCYGSQFYETPNIDRLATEGMRFTDAYAAAPVCSPTRASVLTGKYPARLHLTDWIPGHGRLYAKLEVPHFSQQLPLEEITIAEALRSGGYVSASLGKWHLGKEAFYPEHQGFALNFGGTHKGQPPSYFYPYRIPTIEGGVEGEYLPDRIADEAVNFIESNTSNPFFLYLPHFAVHTPLQAKREIISKYQSKVKPGQKQNNATYAAMIQSVDEAVGRVLDTLERLNISEQTVVIFTSDNGGLARVTDVAPLRSGKGSAYEGGVRVPLIVRWPGAVQPGSVSRVPVISPDFLPTILEIADVSLRPDHEIDGQSLVPVLRQGGSIDRDSIFLHYPHYHPGGATPFSAVRKDNLKLIEFLESGKIELYDLAKDIGESEDLAELMPEKSTELHRVLKDWRKRVNAQMPSPNLYYDPERQGEWGKRRKKSP